jgi:hypothetical protein
VLCVTLCTVAMLDIIETEYAAWKFVSKWKSFGIKRVLKKNWHTNVKRHGAQYKYSSTLSLTSALDGGGWLTPRSGRFVLGNDPVPIV